MATASLASSSHELEKDTVDPDKEHTSLPPEDTEKQTNNDPQQEPEYITGIKLWLMTAGVTLVLFVMLLDISIVSTVSTLSMECISRLY
jgi:hypothetical protein